MTNEEAINCIDDILQSTIQNDETLEHQLSSFDFDWLEKAKAALEKQINAPLTLDEVKELKYGDIVWLKYIKDNYLQIIQFVEISGTFLTFDTFGNEMLCNRFFSGINKVYEIYRNKPEEVEE